MFLFFSSPGGICPLNLYMEEKTYRENGVFVPSENHEFRKMLERAVKYVGRLNYNHFNFPVRLENMTKTMYDDIMIDRASVNSPPPPIMCPEPED